MWTDWHSIPIKRSFHELLATYLVEIETPVFLRRKVAYEDDSVLGYGTVHSRRIIPVLGVCTSSHLAVRTSETSIYSYEATLHHIQ
jgi:hypothetical protein